MRNISADIFADEFFGTLSKVHRLLWLGLLLNIADDQGRMIDNVALIRSLLFPYDDDVTLKDIDKGLTIFVAKHKITRYVAGTNGSGKRLMQVVNWWKYQKSAQWANRSQYQAPAKWNDRIRVHDKGNVIYLENWEQPGGYELATKRLRSRKVAPAKPHQSREDDINVKDDVKESSSLKRALEIFNTHKMNVKAADHAALAEILPHLKGDWLPRAIKIAVENNKHSAAYVIGILKNWRSENANHPRRNKQSTDKPANGSGQSSATTAATLAAAKRIAERKQASV